MLVGEKAVEVMKAKTTHWLYYADLLTRIYGGMLMAIWGDTNHFIYEAASLPSTTLTDRTKCYKLYTGMPIIKGCVRDTSYVYVNSTL